MYELWIGLRYAYSRRGQHFISFISNVSILGIALGVAALIVVLSVMNGFHKELRARILSIAAHVEIVADQEGLNDWHQFKLEVDQVKGVLASAPFLDGQAMLSSSHAVKGVLVRGVEPVLEQQLVDLGRHADLTKALLPGEFGIVLGVDLARSLGVQVGEQVTMIVPQGQATVIGLVPRLKLFRVTGLFEVGMYEYDASLAFIHLGDAQKIYRMHNKVSGIRLKVDDIFSAPRVAQDVGLVLTASPTGFFVTNWTHNHANFFQAIQMEKRVMFIILLLIVAVAAFNIVSTLVMVVTEKRSDIAILRTIGAKPLSIMFIFMVQGCFIGFLGVLLGVASGVLLAINVGKIVSALESLFNVSFLSKEIYLISSLPSDLQMYDVLVIAFIGFALSALATIYPSWCASRIHPVDALRESA